jgi:hypothetical protein
VQAAFASSNFALKRKGAFTFAELFFDSFLQPAFEGPRSSGNLTRRLLYSADHYEIDLQIDLRPDGNTLVVTGQVVDLSQQGIAGCDVRVAISNLRSPVEQTTTDQFGEFRKEIAASGELEVLFPGLGDKPVVISLRDPLGLAARKRAHTHSKIRRRTRNHQQR